MRQITLKVNDSMFDHFLYLINHLDSSEIQIVEENSLSSTTNQASENPSIKSKVEALLKTNPSVFSELQDPVAWQQEQRNEWN